MTSAHDALMTAAALVRTGWCQGTMAMDAGGNHVHYNDPAARRWCLVGAMKAAVERDLAWWAIDTLIPAGMFPVDWNDHPARTAEEVAALLEEAAILASTSSPWAMWRHSAQRHYRDEQPRPRLRVWGRYIYYFDDPSDLFAQAA